MVQFLACPDGMQVVSPALFIQAVDPWSVVNQPVQKELILGKAPEERIPLRQAVALGGVQGRVHWHQIPELVIHNKGPGYKVVNVILLQLHWLVAENISDLR